MRNGSASKTLNSNTSVYNHHLLAFLLSTTSLLLSLLFYSTEIPGEALEPCSYLQSLKPPETSSFPFELEPIIFSSGPFVLPPHPPIRSPILGQCCNLTTDHCWRKWHFHGNGCHGWWWMVFPFSAVLLGQLENAFLLLVLLLLSLQFLFVAVSGHSPHSPYLSLSLINNSF